MSSPEKSIKIGLGGASLAVIGASAGATSAAGLIVATGGTAAVVLLGMGLYKYYSSKAESEEENS
jgi:hypothetical protein